MFLYLSVSILFYFTASLCWKHCTTGESQSTFKALSMFKMSYSHICVVLDSSHFSDTPSQGHKQDVSPEMEAIPLELWGRFCTNGV